jgi:hypothetical protein
MLAPFPTYGAGAMRPLALVLPAVVPLTLACAPPQPPAPAVQREGTEVPAAFARSWDAVIEEFAARNISIATIERASGFIAAERVRVPYDVEYLNAGHPFADCGRDMMKRYNLPTDATYNVLVRPIGADSARSRVKVTARFVMVSTSRGTMLTPATASTADCSTKGRWETEFEERILARATAPR